MVLSLKIESNADRVWRVFDRWVPSLRRSLTRTLRQTSNDVVKEAQRLLTANKTNYTGSTRASLRPTVNERNLTATVEAVAKHAQFVEFGRRAGGMPPPPVIERWIRVKLGDNPHRRLSGGQTLLSAILHKIAARGTDPQPFLQPAFDRVGVARLRSNLERELRVATRALERTQP